MHTKNPYTMTASHGCKPEAEVFLPVQINYFGSDHSPMKVTLKDGPKDTSAAVDEGSTQVEHHLFEEKPAVRAEKRREISVDESEHEKVLIEISEPADKMRKQE